MEHTILSDNQVRNPDFPSFGLVSIWFGAILTTLTMFTFATPGSEGSYLTLPLVQGLKFLLMAMLLASVFYLPLNAQHGVKWAALPLFINVGTLMIVQLVPFTQLWEAARFHWRVGQYENVVQLVEGGQLVVSENGTILLPEEYRVLSPVDGRIAVETSGGITSIFFFTEQKGPLAFAGYLYRSDMNPPQQGEFMGRWQYVLPKQDHWYYCVSE
ncbi:MAG: hypothetical protein R3D55_12290 [Chloroflexota bacterium]